MFKKSRSHKDKSKGTPKPVSSPAEQPRAPVQEQAAPPPVAAPPPTDEDGIVFTGEMKDGRPIIKGGTIDRLVERLTFPAYADLEYLKAFMLTYRSFTSPLEFMGMLKQRYLLQPPPGSDPKTFETNVLRPVRLRVYNCLKHWIQKGFYDFVDDEQLATELQDFIKNTMATTGMENPAKQLQKMFDRQMSGQQTDRDIQFSQTPPTPIIPMNVTGSLTLMDIHPEELARQLTLIEYDLYKNIKPWECLNQSWAKKDKETRAPNILAMIQRFNQVSNWVATEVVKVEQVKQRAKVLQHVIEIAEHCKSLNNFNAMMEIISGLQNSAVFRLKQTWGTLPSKYNKSYSDMHQIMSREQNYKNARAFLHNVDPPCIPYLGVYLTDLTFIEDGNKDNLPENDYINFSKRQKVSQVISEIQQYQHTPYCLEPVQFIRDYLTTVESLDENTCYQMSLEREERNAGAAKRAGRSNTRAPPREEQEEADPDNPYGILETIPGYPFGEPDTEKNLVLVRDVNTPSPPIKGGTVVKLVERVTYDKSPDMNYMMAFLMTYKTFSSPEELLELLDKRWNMPRPKAPSAGQAARFLRERQLPIHLRVINVLKFWVDKYSVDFTESAEMREKMLENLQKWEEGNDKIRKPVEQIKKILDKATAAAEVEQVQPKLLGEDYKGGESPSVTEFDAQQLAERIVVMDQAMFSRVEGRECLCGVWEGDKAEEGCPNILRMRVHFDLMKRWVMTEVLKAPDLPSMGLVVGHFIRVAEYLYSMKAFNALVAIIHAMMHAKWMTPVWEFIPQQLVMLYGQIHALVKHPKKLREKEKSDDITTPTIPYLELYLRQLSGIHDMLPDTLQNDLINFEKRRKIFDVYSIWQSFQAHPFELDHVPAVEEYLDAVHIFSNDEIKQRSMAIPAAPPGAGRPSLEQMPNPEKKAVKEKPRSFTLKDTESQTLSSDTTLSPRALDESMTDQLKGVVATVLSEEKALLADLMAEAKKELQEDLLTGLRTYTASVHDEMIIMNGQYGLADAAQVKSAAQRIVSRKFGGGDVKEWSVLDQQGVVYGWQETIYLFVADDGNTKHLVHVAAHVDSPALGTILRMVELYARSTGSTDLAGHTVTIISPSINESAYNIAKQRSVNVMAF
eukprot:TRINITY_DN2846_c0_g1_i1.p1 TRINITY_DN2846_c0_g1~~TRINITY_DN2846_c0_g1_i1.p1  ORF type:complete len:1130 (-),score=536.32 TRINITY_DN2846_c0_g1_i1:96-3485(-)